VAARRWKSPAMARPWQGSPPPPAGLHQASGLGRNCGDPECWRWNRKIPCSTPRLLMPCGEGSARHPYLDLVVVGLRAPLHRPSARLGPAGRRRWLLSLGHEPLGSTDVAQQGASFAGSALLGLAAAGFSPWCRCAAAAGCGCGAGAGSVAAKLPRRPCRSVDRGNRAEPWIAHRHP